MSLPPRRIPWPLFSGTSSLYFQSRPWFLLLLKLLYFVIISHSPAYTSTDKPVSFFTRYSISQYVLEWFLRSSKCEKCCSSYLWIILGKYLKQWEVPVLPNWISNTSSCQPTQKHTFDDKIDSFLNLSVEERLRRGEFPVKH